MTEKLFIVEDDPDVAEILVFNLTDAGFNVVHESNGLKAYDKLIDDPPDLLILDLNLPGLSGMEICKYIRETPNTQHLPIIMLTARSQESDKIYGLNTGADDYITKPFAINELMARINALLRRVKPTRDDLYNYKNLSINFNTRKVECGENEVTLTPIEFKLLRAFIQSKGKTLSRFDLLDLAWGSDYSGDVRTVDVHVKRLRDKLDSCRDFIETVKGAGYRCNMD